MRPAMSVQVLEREFPNDHLPLLRWLMFTGVCVFGFVLIWYYGLFRLMLASDKTYISSIIVILYAATCVHCFVRTIAISRESDRAHRVLSLVSHGGRIDQTLLLRGLADALRGPNQLGSFASDSLMKLGLLGTIVGFILMLAPIAGLDAADKASMKLSMGLMSDGMAVAMYTTLAGLIGALPGQTRKHTLHPASPAPFRRAPAPTSECLRSAPQRG